jgi:hypothetical protein
MSVTLTALRAARTRRLVNKCDWIAQFALFSQFVTCLGRIVHHSPRAAKQFAIDPVPKINGPGLGRPSPFTMLLTAALSAAGSYGLVGTTTLPEMIAALAASIFLM